MSVDGRCQMYSDNREGDCVPVTTIGRTINHDSPFEVFGNFEIGIGYEIKANNAYTTS
jgi:hypothetical protein